MQAVAAGTWTGFPFLYAWGLNSKGQLGLNDIANRSSPVQVDSLNTWHQITTGSLFNSAVKTNGTLWSWGYNNSGQLGQNNTTNRSSPVQIGALTTWSKVAAGYTHSLAIKTDGSLWSWGDNGYGKLGLGNVIPAFSSPVQVGALTTWSQVAGGRNFSLSIKTDGTIWGWGRNQNGQLGIGYDNQRISPVQVGALTTWLTLPKMPMAQHSLAIKG